MECAHLMVRTHRVQDLHKTNFTAQKNNKIINTIIAGIAGSGIDRVKTDLFYLLA